MAKLRQLRPRILYFSSDDQALCTWNTDPPTPPVEVTQIMSVPTRSVVEAPFPNFCILPLPIHPPDQPSQERFFQMMV